jgi:hypothetical protein
MPPAAHPHLDLLVSADDFAVDMPSRSPSSSSSLTVKHLTVSSSILEMENLPLTIVEKTILNDSRDEATFSSRDQSSTAITDNPSYDMASSHRSLTESIEGVKNTRNATLRSDASKNSTSKHSKRVRFLDTTGAIQVIKTIHVFDYTDEELSSSFYSAKDMRDFQQERRDLARMLDQGISVDEIFVTRGCGVRGIETATYDGNRHRRGHISEAIHCVMLEQQLQYEDCNWNPDFIALIYRRVSEESQREARERGLKDEQEASEELESVRKVYKDFVNQTATAPSLWLPEEIPFGILVYKL